ncbi:MAG: hypothetical protein Q9182_006490 [Xanthomendoza sp. 2 TL-2023]
MGDWNTNDSWSGGGGVAAESSSWNAGAEPASNWDNGAKDFETNGVTTVVTDTHAGVEASTDNAQGGVDDRACRICNETGHLARHMLSECTNNKVFDFEDVVDMSEDDAWDHVIKAGREAAETRDLDEFREAIKVYQKAVKDISYEQLELSFRTHELGIFIIAVEPREGEVLDTHTLVDLSGKKDCKYKVGYFFKKTPRTGKLAEVWPASEEENLARLKDAGSPYERGIPKCIRCKGMGHTIKACTVEEGEVEKLTIKCVICETEGHRARDCKQVRVDRFACRNCNLDMPPRTALNPDLQKGLSWAILSRNALKPMLQVLMAATIRPVRRAGVPEEEPMRELQNGTTQKLQEQEQEQELRSGITLGLRSMLRALGVKSQLPRLSFRPEVDGRGRGHDFQPDEIRTRLILQGYTQGSYGKVACDEKVTCTKMSRFSKRGSGRKQ